MGRSLLCVFVATVCVGTVAAQDRVKLEGAFASEHVPNGVKAGDRVDLVVVLSATTTKTGLASYSTRPVVQKVEVASVTKVEKPKTPEEAVKVELWLTKDDAARVERLKA